MKRTVRLLLHMAAPILFGAVLYFILCPNVWFVERLQELLCKWSFLFWRGNGSWMISEEDGVSGTMRWAEVFLTTSTGRFIRNYLFDFLWGYSLAAGIKWILGDSIRYERVLALLFIFSLVMEGLQLFTAIAGTFDIWDVASEVLAGIIFLIIYKNFLTEGTNEKI